MVDERGRSSSCVCVMFLTRQAKFQIYKLTKEFEFNRANAVERTSRIYKEERGEIEKPFDEGKNRQGLIPYLLV